MSTVALVWAAILLHHAVTKNQNRRKFYTSSSEGLNQTPFSQLPLLSPYVSVLFLPILFKDLYKQYGICFRYMFNISNGKVIWECFVYHLINQPFSWSLRQQPWYPKLSNGLFTFSGDDNVLSKAPGMVPNWTVRQTLLIQHADRRIFKGRSSFSNINRSVKALQSHTIYFKQALIQLSLRVSSMLHWTSVIDKSSSQ